MAPNQVVLAQNCVLTNEGILQTREGKTKVNTTSLGSGAVLGIWRWGKENGTYYLTVQHGTSLYSTTWDGVSQISSFGAAVKTGLTAGAKLRGVAWKDNLILSNGVDAPFRFDGSTCTNLSGTPPLFKIFCVYASRLWVVPTTALNSVRSSGLEDYNAWDALDIYNIRTGDGDTITGLYPDPNGIVVTKLNTLWALYGSNRYDVIITQSPVYGAGCASHDAMLAPGVFLGKGNLHTFSLTGGEPLGLTHSPVIQGLTLADKKAAFGVVDELNRRAIIQVNSSNIFCIDGQYNGAVTMWKGLNANCFAYAKAAGDLGAVLIGDATNGWIYKLAGTDDDSIPIDTYIKTAYTDCGSIRKKVFRYYQPEIELLDQSDYQFYARYDVDFKALYGSQSYTGNTPNYLDWGVDSWGIAYWGNSGQANIKDPFYFHGVRGDRVSFEVKSNQRLRYKGHVWKFREAGPV